MDNGRRHVDSSPLKKKDQRGKSVGLILNVIAILLAIRFLFYPPRAALFLPFDGFVLFGLGACGVLIALPLSCMAMLAKGTMFDGLLGLLLSLTPIPVYMVIFILVNRTKDFRFW